MPPRRPPAGRPSAGGRPKPRVNAPPPTLGAALQELLRLKGVADAGGNRQLADAWRAAAGDRVADRTRVVGVRHGTLHVGVQNSALLGELASFHRDRLLADLREKLPESRLKALKFKLNGELRKPPGERPRPTDPPDPAFGKAEGRENKNRDGRAAGGPGVPERGPGA